MFDLSDLTMTEIVRLQNQLQQELTRRFERRLMLVFSDIVGSTAYFARFGDAMGRQLQQLHCDLLGLSLAEVGGRIVDTAGDGAFMAFPNAGAALRGIIDFHHRMVAENGLRSGPHQLRVRVGMHWGSVLTDGVAVSGDAVNLCAHIASSAVAGEIRMTREVFGELELTHRWKCHVLGPVALKGGGVPVELLTFELRDPNLFPRRVRITETGAEIELPQQDIVSFGRLADHDGVPANDIVLTHPAPELARQVSRWHFELRRGADGLHLRALSDSETRVDGELVAKGRDVAVHAGSSIRVAHALTLTLIGDDSVTPQGSDSTMLVERTELPLRTEPAG